MNARACDACGAPARWTADLGARGETLACDACRDAAVDVVSVDARGWTCVPRASEADRKAGA